MQCQHCNVVVVIVSVARDRKLAAAIPFKRVKHRTKHLVVLEVGMQCHRDRSYDSTVSFLQLMETFFSKLQTSSHQTSLWSLQCHALSSIVWESPANVRDLRIMTHLLSNSCWASL